MGGISTRQKAGVVVAVSLVIFWGGSEGVWGAPSVVPAQAKNRSVGEGAASTGETTFSLSAFPSLPFAVPLTQASLSRQISQLLRNFRAIQRSEVVVSGAPGRDLSIQIVVQPRAGALLTREILESIVLLVQNVAGGLDVSRLNIVSAEGRVLVAQGRVLVTPEEGTVAGSARGAIFGGVLLAVLLSGVAIWRRYEAWRARNRRLSQLDRLLLHNLEASARWLTQQRPEVAGLLLANAERRVARELERRVQALGGTVRWPQQRSASGVEAVELITEALAEHLGEY